MGTILDLWVPITLIALAGGFGALAARAFGRIRREGIGAGPFVPLAAVSLVLCGVALMVLAGTYR